MKYNYYFKNLFTTAMFALTGLLAGCNLSSLQSSLSGSGLPALGSSKQNTPQVSSGGVTTSTTAQKSSSTKSSAQGLGSASKSVSNSGSGSCSVSTQPTADNNWQITMNFGSDSNDGLFDSKIVLVDNSSQKILGSVVNGGTGEIGISGLAYRGEEKNPELTIYGISTTSNIVLDSSHSYTFYAVGVNVNAYPYICANGTAISLKVDVENLLTQPMEGVKVDTKNRQITIDQTVSFSQVKSGIKNTSSSDFQIRESAYWSMDGNACVFLQPNSTQWFFNMSIQNSTNEYYAAVVFVDDSTQAVIGNVTTGSAFHNTFANEKGLNSEINYGTNISLDGNHSYTMYALFSSTSNVAPFGDCSGDKILSLTINANNLVAIGGVSAIDTNNKVILLNKTFDASTVSSAIPASADSNNTTSPSWNLDSNGCKFFQ